MYGCLSAKGLPPPPPPPPLNIIHNGREQDEEEEEEAIILCPITGKKSMSAQPSEELGSEGKWFGDDYERNGLFGNTTTRFGEVASDLDQQFHPFQDDGKRPPVAMETASTGKAGHLS